MENRNIPPENQAYYTGIRSYLKEWMAFEAWVHRVHQVSSVWAWTQEGQPLSLPGDEEAKVFWESIRVRLEEEVNENGPASWKWSLRVKSSSVHWYKQTQLEFWVVPMEEGAWSPVRVATCWPFLAQVEWNDLPTEEQWEEKRKSVQQQIEQQESQSGRVDQVETWSRVWQEESAWIQKQGWLGGRLRRERMKRWWSLRWHWLFRRPQVKQLLKERQRGQALHYEQLIAELEEIDYAMLEWRRCSEWIGEAFEDAYLFFRDLSFSTASQREEPDDEERGE